MAIAGSLIIIAVWFFATPLAIYRGENPDLHIPPPKADRTCGAGDRPANESIPFWSVWAEYPPASKATYHPERLLRPNKDYTVVLDMAALEYRLCMDVWSSQPVTADINHLPENNPKSARLNLQVLLIPDERLFDSLPAENSVRQFDLDLGKIRTVRSKGFTVAHGVQQDLEEMGPRAEFVYGEQLFRLHTSGASGQGYLSFSIWLDGKPIDEVTAAVCVSIGELECNHPILGPSLLGVDLDNPSTLPGAALHIIDAWSTLIGVFRCNVCPNPSYFTWTIDRSTSDFSAEIDKITSKMVEARNPSARVSKDYQLTAGGDALFNLIFPQPSANAAADEFRRFVAIAQSQEPPDGKTALALFVRLLPHSSTLVFTPLNLMRVRINDAPPVFIGFLLNVQNALPLQDYSAPTTCSTGLELFVAPKNPPKTPAGAITTDYDEVIAARRRADSWITSIAKTCGDCVIANEEVFHNWLMEDITDQDKVVITLSHYGEDSLYLSESGDPNVMPTVARTFGPASLAILDGCGTAATHNPVLVRNLNAAHVYSFVATSADIEPEMGGDFLRILLDDLALNAGDPAYNIGTARFDAVNQLSKTFHVRFDPSTGINVREQYGPKALLFLLAGKGTVRVCPPSPQIHPNDVAPKPHPQGAPL